MKKGCLIVGTITIILGCMLTITFAQGFWKNLTDAHRVDTVAHRIADFDLPAGFRTDYVIEVLDYSVAAYISQDEHSHLILLQAPEGMAVNEGTLQGYVANNRDDMDWQTATVTRTYQRNVRDYPATVTISDRLNHEGQRYRQFNMLFEGKGGPALLIINQPVTQWHDETIDAFIDSIN